MKTSTTQIAMMAFGAIGLVVIGIIWLRHEMKPKARKAAQSMAGPRDVARLTPKQVEKTARRLRKLDGKVTPGETGVAIGRLIPHGPQLRTTWRDGVLGIMAPGGGKTACLAGPAGLEADGPVVDTSNKRDLRDILIQRAGKHWTFDPQHIVGPQDFWWDALDGLDNVSDAHNFAAQFVTTIEDDSKRDIWGPSAIQLIRAYTLAANLIGGDMLDIYRWICDPDTGEALDILDRHGFAQVVQGVNVTLNSASNTRKGVYITAKTAMQCLEDPTISRWVTRQPGLPCFDPEAFVAGTDTLHLLSKDGGEGAGPLVAAFTARVLDAGVRYAERQTNGRLARPMVVILDEAKNVCRIAKLPQLCSHYGSRNITLMLLFQSYAQMVSGWGKTGAEEMWTASTVKLIGSGQQDARFASDIAELVGKHYVPAPRSYTTGHNGGSSNRSMVQQPILSVSDIAALKQGSAIVLANGCRPALVDLEPWFEDKRWSRAA